MNLRDAFSIRNREVISLAGAGGKTSLLFALGNELSAGEKGVLLTTTTKIWEPVPSPSFALFLSEQISEIKEWVLKNLGKYPYLIIARKKLDDGKLQGILPEWSEELLSLAGVSSIIVEADGAAGRSLKAPREGEPVLPEDTTLIVPIVGIDVLGRPLEEQYVFRSQIAARMLNVPMGTSVTEEMIASLLAAIVKDRPEKARVIPFINKVDLPSGLEKARTLAAHLLKSGGAKLERVVLGQARYFPVVKENIFH